MICLPCSSGVGSALPVLWLLFWPLSAAVWGPQAVARQSIMLVVYILLTDSLNNWLTRNLESLGKLFGPLLEVAFLVGLLSLPFPIIPSPVIACYTVLLKYGGEPFLLYVEMRQLLALISKSGDKITYWVFSDAFVEVDAVKYLIIFLAALTYALGFYILHSSLLLATATFFTHVALLLVLVNLIAGIATIAGEEGVITNAALVFLTSSILFYISSTSNTALAKFSDLSFLDADKSFLELLSQLPELTTVRLACLLRWLMGPVDSRTLLDDDDEDEEDGAAGVWKGLRRMWDTKTLARLLAVLLYAEMIVQRTPDTRSAHSPGTRGDSVIVDEMIVKSILIGLYYTKSLYGAISENESEDYY